MKKNPGRKERRAIARKNIREAAKEKRIFNERKVSRLHGKQN